METQNSKRASVSLKIQGHQNGSALFLVVLSLFVLSALGVGMLTVGYGARLKAIRLKNEAAAMLAADAGYEQAIFWMSQQQDMLSALQDGLPGTSGTLNFPDGDCNYQIGFFAFLGARPVYRVTSSGQSGIFRRTVDVQVLQAMSGWDMGMCRVASGVNGTYPVNFADGEIIDLPLHINNMNDNPDNRDIYIIGSPQFLQSAAMGEPRYTAQESDKYSGVIDLFDGGIYFDQPDSKITDEASVQTKVDRFRDSTKAQFRLTPSGTAPITNPNSAVQLEFFVEGGVGKVRITNNCTVRGFQQNNVNRTWDLRIQSGSGGTRYERYNIYAYHLMPADADATGERSVQIIDQSYVTQSIGSVESEPGGQIYVDGNVIIGSGDSALPGQDKIKGKMTVVATGNIWVADSIVADGAHDAGGKPTMDNPNVLGLVAQGIIKVVDPGMSDYSYVDDTPVEPAGFEYVPIGLDDGGLEHERHLPDPMVVEAALTLGGGGWGAENVRRGSYGGRKETTGNQDQLVVRGTITEAIRGVVGLIGNDGYLKAYYLDERLLEGVLPGDMWLRGKYIPAPAGWRDYRPTN
ncbi:MAG: hypothetical protein ISS70_02125 [Phycisphaerae bacterium]|nr:hypothetical protein [Phycisphaerae bacterium]